jgi:hypothetical protein
MMYSNPWMYSNEQMNVLKKEHGFLAYLDETFAEPDEIMHALLAGAMSTKSLGGELVIEFLSTRESNDSRKQSLCFLLERPHPPSAGTIKSQRRVGTRKRPKKNQN